MTVHDATEQAFKNGYAQAIRDMYTEIIVSKQDIDIIVKRLLDKHNITTDM
jgi:hypothetical protein